MAKLHRNGMQALRVSLGHVALAGTSGGASTLRDKLSGEGSGVHYAGQPRRSSAESEYPAEQTGELRDSIAAQPAGPEAARFGPLHDPPDYLTALHGKPPSDGGRPFMLDALHDRDIHQAVLDAAEQEARRQFGPGVRLARGRRP